jgi:hypothetical protein
MKKMVIENNFKRITIAYEPRECVTRKQLTDLTSLLVRTERDYTVYCNLLKFAAKLADTEIAATKNVELLSELKQLIGSR